MSAADDPECSGRGCCSSCAPVEPGRVLTPCEQDGHAWNMGRCLRCGERDQSGRLCSSCGRARAECRTADSPFLSCCTTCAANDGDTHQPGRVQARSTVRCVCGAGCDFDVPDGWEPTPPSTSVTCMDWPADQEPAWAQRLRILGPGAL